MIVGKYSLSLFECCMIFAAAAIFVIAVIRLNNMTRQQVGSRWWIRRISKLMIMSSMTMYITSHFSTYAPYWSYLQQILLFYGLLLSWLTTPPSPRLWKKSPPVAPKE